MANTIITLSQFNDRFRAILERCVTCKLCHSDRHSGTVRLRPATHSSYRVMSNDRDDSTESDFIAPDEPRSTNPLRSRSRSDDALDAVAVSMV